MLTAGQTAYRTAMQEHQQPLRCGTGSGGQQSFQLDTVMSPGEHADWDRIGRAQHLQAVIGAARLGADEPGRAVVITADGKCILATRHQGKQPIAG